jgi:hypothetical protein
MGIPYSKQINAAFDEVTPLVARGFDILQTTRDLSILLAAIQVLTVLLLGLLLVTQTALLITLNPDLEAERRAVVTPAVRHIAHLAAYPWAMRAAVLCLMMIGGGGAWYASRSVARVMDKHEDERQVEGEKRAEEAAAAAAKQ